MSHEQNPEQQNPLGGSTGSTPRQKGDCAEVSQLIPAYSIGATTPEETRRIEALLPECPELERELVAYLTLAEGLLHLVPDIQAPPSAESLMARVQQYEEDLQHGAAAGTTELDTMPEMPVIFPAYATTRDSVADSVIPASNRRIQAAPLRWAMAAALLLLMIMNGVLAIQITTLQRHQEHITALLTETNSVVRQASFIVSLPPDTSSDQHRHLLATHDGPGDSSGILIWNPDQQIGSVYAANLPPLPEGMSYQLWLVSDDEQLSLGTFDVAEDGIGSLTFHSPKPIESFKLIGITTEPVTGSQEPTTPHLVIGEI